MQFPSRYCFHDTELMVFLVEVIWKFSAYKSGSRMWSPVAAGRLLSSSISECLYLSDFLCFVSALFLLCYSSCLYDICNFLNVSMKRKFSKILFLLVAFQHSTFCQLMSAKCPDLSGTQKTGCLSSLNVFLFIIFPFFFQNTAFKWTHDYIYLFLSCYSNPQKKKAAKTF